MKKTEKIISKVLLAVLLIYSVHDFFLQQEIVFEKGPYIATKKPLFTKQAELMTIEHHIFHTPFLLETREYLTSVPELLVVCTDRLNFYENSTLEEIFTPPKLTIYIS